ncbi:MAG: rod shape-determining protein RodA [Candidatus Cloacimonadota bacterium]|nr:MAG: rod shape-determining protein RodA [Candidatus Cloacimonadota bacterium]PIE80185.1 MAG: rod shape-determining protein RodA [Candidatus Delongbacteria bacterium]
MVKKETDYPLIISSIILILIGIIAIYSSGEDLGFPKYQKQLIWFILGLAGSFIIQFINPKKLMNISIYLYTIMIVSLVAVLFFGTSHMGARRWLNLGFYEIQPSEFGKIILVIVLANFYSKFNIKINRFNFTNFIAAAITLLPVLLIYKQPDLGTSLVYLAIFGVIMFANGLDYFHAFNLFMIIFSIIFKALGYQFFVSYLIVYGFILFKFGKKRINIAALWLINFSIGMGTSFIWDRLKPYQKLRITSFLNPEKHIQKGGWQIVQSKTAIANGGFFGRGINGGSQTQLGFLPEGHTDFIFSVIIEEMGAITGILVLFLFFVIIYRTIMISLKVNNKHYYLLCVGIASIFLYQVFINIGMTIGVMPITGLPLPFLSYGGSSLLFNMVLVALLVNISRNRRDY